MPKFYILEAAIGAGKSTLLDILERLLKRQGKRVTIIPEPIDVWEKTGALEAFYADVSGQSYAFQTFAFATRCQRVRQVVQANPDMEIFLMERSVVSDRYLFARMLQRDGKFTPLQSLMYEEWAGLWTSILPFAQPDGFIYLAPSLDATLERIENRGRKGEHVPPEYQQDLIDHHEVIFGCGIGSMDQVVAVTEISGAPVPVLRIYSDADYRSDDNHEVLQKIIRFIQ